MTLRHSLDDRLFSVRAGGFRGDGGERAVQVRNADNKKRGVHVNPPFL